MSRSVITRQGKAEKVEKKPGSDSHRTVVDDSWERDRRVRLPHDHLVAPFALTHAEFEAGELPAHIPAPFDREHKESRTRSRNARRGRLAVGTKRGPV